MTSSKLIKQIIKKRRTYVCTFFNIIFCHFHTNNDGLSRIYNDDIQCRILLLNVL